MKDYRVIFWDFDGVIKDSLEVKGDAFYGMFEPFGIDVAMRVRDHHERNGGMSRYEKLPLYLHWSGVQPSPKVVDEFAERFGQIVTNRVIDSSWVRGVESYLRENPYEQTYILVSATPHDELLFIVESLRLTECFFEVHGSPLSKQEALHNAIQLHGFNPDLCLMIGDSLADYEAANANEVSFLLRRHQTNAGIFADYTGPSICDFTLS